MKNYLSNITNIAVDSVYPNDESEQDDETSIQEIIKLNLNNPSDGKSKGNYFLVLEFFFKFALLGFTS